MNYLKVFGGILVLSTLVGIFAWSNYSVSTSQAEECAKEKFSYVLDYALSDELNESSFNGPKKMDATRLTTPYGFSWSYPKNGDLEEIRLTFLVGRFCEVETFFTRGADYFDFSKQSNFYTDKFSK